MSMGVMDMRASLQARASLENDVRNLKVAVDSKDMSHVEPESKVWAFVGHQGRRVLVDRRNPEPPPLDNARYCASSYKVGYRSTEINPVSGTHSYDTGNLYRTVHWRPVGQGFGLNGYFTNDLARAGMWRNEGLNASQTRSKVMDNPSQWGTPKYNLAFM